MNHTVAPGRRSTRQRPTKPFLVLALAMSAAGLASAQGLPEPEASGIEHVVVVTMENRSFDHLLGWVPRADGRQEGLAFLDEDGNRRRTSRLAPDYQGCASRPGSLL
jgi:phospholipase C